MAVGYTAAGGEGVDSTNLGFDALQAAAGDQARRVEGSITSMGGGSDISSAELTIRSLEIQEDQSKLDMIKAMHKTLANVDFKSNADAIKG